MSADPSPATPPEWMTPLLDRLDRLVAALERAPDAPGEWLTAADLSALLRVSERSIRTWEQTGQLPPPARVGRLKKWNRAEVERHLSKTAR